MRQSKLTKKRKTKIKTKTNQLIQNFQIQSLFLKND